MLHEKKGRIITLGTKSFFICLTINQISLLLFEYHLIGYHFIILTYLMNIHDAKWLFDLI